VIQDISQYSTSVLPVGVKNIGVFDGQVECESVFYDMEVEHAGDNADNSEDLLNLSFFRGQSNEWRGFRHAY
jgi:hypothetical protein